MYSICIKLKHYVILYSSDLISLRYGVLYKVETCNYAWIMPTLTETVVLGIGALDTAELGRSSTLDGLLLATLKFGFAAAK